eukprot:5720318-Prymnesium_polylepis.1
MQRILKAYIEPVLGACSADRDRKDDPASTTSLDLDFRKAQMKAQLDAMRTQTAVYKKMSEEAASEALADRLRQMAAASEAKAGILQQSLERLENLDLDFRRAQMKAQLDAVRTQTTELQKMSEEAASEALAYRLRQMAAASEVTEATLQQKLAEI